MENKEFTYQGKTLNGILMLVLNIIGFLAGVGLFIFACVSQEDWLTNVCGVCGVLLLILSIICVCGFILVEPGQARVLAESVYQSEEAFASCAQPRCRTYQGE